MHKKYWVAGTATALLGTIAAVAWAAQIENLNGQSCGSFSGDWHFVNNQTGGAGAGTLTAYFETGPNGGECMVPAEKVNRSNQHFYCRGYGGDLLWAETDLPGRLVLSDYACDSKPPPCDPKDPKCTS